MLLTKQTFLTKKIPDPKDQGFPKNNTTQLMWFDPEP